MADTLGQDNPFRYRGYYYDSETGFYYLNSRYYDPESGRFLNLDAIISGVGGNIIGNNSYIYCFNNPINMSDSEGNWPKWVKDVAKWYNKNIVQHFYNISNAFVNSLELKGNMGFGLGIDITVANLGAHLAMKAKFPEVTINNEISSESIGEIEAKLDLIIAEVGYFYSESLTGEHYRNEEYFFKIKDRVTLFSGEIYCFYGLGFSIDLRLDKFIEELELIYE